MTGQTLIKMSEKPALKTVVVKTFCVAMVALFVGSLVIEAYARGGRGGGGGRSFSHVGPASGGSFASRGAGRGEARQYGRSDRMASRGEGRTERTEGRQDYRGDRQEARTDRQENRQDYRTDRQENRQDYRDDARDDWQDHYDDRWDNWGPWGYAAAGAAVVAGAYAIGSAISADSYYALSCTPNTVVVDGVAYSQCGDAWYQPAYSGGTTTYVVVEPPAGY